MQTVSTAPAFSTVDITPRNETCIGGGIQEGAGQLAAATHPNRSMLVLTDGNENFHPYIAELPAGTITNRTYAIGFGLPGEVSDAALQQITSNTHGDLIITGLLSSDEQRFNLTKYFVQVLAGVTNSQVILDPKGKLFLGSQDRIPFKVCEADVYVDAIALCPVPAYLDFTLETPDGTAIKPAGAGPNVQYIAGQQVLCYRMTLPALPADAAGSHAGTWNAVLAIKDPKDIDRLLSNRAFAATSVEPRLSNFLPYSFLVHATSNLKFTAWRVQDALKPGAAVTLYASLSEYDVPLNRPASVWAEVTRPDQSTFAVTLNRGPEGLYSRAFATGLAGVYTCRVHAEGYSSKGKAFTREKTLTAGVYYGNYDPRPAPESGGILCELLHCLTKDGGALTPAVRRRFEELGIDLKKLVECLDEICPELATEKVPGIRYRRLEECLAKPQLLSQLRLEKVRPAKPRVDKPRPKRTKPMLPFVSIRTPEPGKGHEHERPKKKPKK